MDNADLESLGILRQTKVPSQLDWMTDSEKHFMLFLLTAGEFGVHRRYVTKEEKKSPELSSRLSANGMADWHRDRSGKEMFFTLSLKGEETAQLLLKIARNANRYMPAEATDASTEATPG
jgi:hypothetical protein